VRCATRRSNSAFSRSTSSSTRFRSLRSVTTRQMPCPDSSKGIWLRDNCTGSTVPSIRRRWPSVLTSRWRAVVTNCRNRACSSCPSKETNSDLLLQASRSVGKDRTEGVVSRSCVRGQTLAVEEICPAGRASTRADSVQGVEQSSRCFDAGADLTLEISGLDLARKSFAAMWTVSAKPRGYASLLYLLPNQGCKSL